MHRHLLADHRALRTTPGIVIFSLPSGGDDRLTSECRTPPFQLSAGGGVKGLGRSLNQWGFRVRVSAWRRGSVLVRWRHSAALNAVAVGALAAPLLLSAGPQLLPRNSAVDLPQVDVGRSVSVRPFVPHPAPASVAHTTSPAPTAVHWPAARSGAAAFTAPGSTSADAARPARTAVPRAGALGVKAYAAGTPVWGRAVQPSQGAYQGPSGMRVSVAAHGSALRAGVTGVLFSVTPSGVGRGPVRLGMDYGAFAQVYGGNYGSRLRLVELPACALTTPQVTACRTQTPLSSVNDPRDRSVSAQITLGEAALSHGSSAVSGAKPGVGGMVFAVNSSPSGGDGGGNAGTYGATSLKPSGSWSAGGSTGSFTYSYPITVPPAASSLVPTVALSYDSGSVDGQTAATQAQADWAGDGWSTPENYIEQSFVSCSDSPEGASAPQATADLCYDGPVLTISLNGSTSSLVCATSCNSGSAVWKPTSDNGEVVTHHVSTNNGTGTFNTDYWTVTDRTGTVFSFGLNQLPGWSSGKATTNSVQSEPVYSAHDPSTSTADKPISDPCYNATWSNSWCTMAYRWNLDYVRDLHGNAMAYYYKQDMNAYAQNGNTTTATGYVRDAHVDHIDYGFTDGGAYGAIPDQVWFSTADRCVSSSCDPIGTYSANWPDVPYDLNCAAGQACQVTGPSFWSTVALSGITTKQNGTVVDTYTLGHAMPAPGDGTAQTLWLSSIARQGQDSSAGGSAVTVPTVSFRSEE